MEFPRITWNQDDSIVIRRDQAEILAACLGVSLEFSSELQYFEAMGEGKVNGGYILEKLNRQLGEFPPMSDY